METIIQLAMSAYRPKAASGLTSVQNNNKNHPYSWKHTPGSSWLGVETMLL